MYLSLPPGEGNKVRLGELVGAWDEPLRAQAASIQFAAPSARLQFSMVLPETVEVVTQPVYVEHRDRDAMRSTLQGLEISAAIPLQLGSGSRWEGDLIVRAIRR